MKLTRKSVIVAAAIIIGTAAAGALAGLPAGWLVVLIAALVALAIIVVRDAVSSNDAPDLIQPEAPPEMPTAPQPPASRAIYDVRVGSAAAEYEFSFSCTAYWTAIGLPSRRNDLGELAITTIVKRARRVLGLVEPTEEAAAKHELTNALQLAQPDDAQQIRVWADNIQVRLPDMYARRAQQRGELRRRQEVADLERQLEKDFRTYLSEDALATPGTATVWWLSKNPTEIEQCVELYQTLRRLSDAANDRIPADSVGDRFAETAGDGRFEADSADGWSERNGIRWPLADDSAGRTVLFAVPERTPEAEPARRSTFAEAIEALLEGLDPAERKLKAFELANLEETFNHPARAQEIRAGYDVTPIGQEPTEAGPTPPDPSTTTPNSTPADQPRSTTPGDPLAPPPPREVTAGHQEAVPTQPEPTTTEHPTPDPAPASATEAAPTPAPEPTPSPSDVQPSYREQFYSSDHDGESPTY